MRGLRSSASPSRRGSSHELDVYASHYFPSRLNKCLFSLDYRLKKLFSGSISSERANKLALNSFFTALPPLRTRLSIRTVDCNDHICRILQPCTPRRSSIWKNNPAPASLTWPILLVRAIWWWKLARGQRYSPLGLSIGSLPYEMAPWPCSDAVSAAQFAFSFFNAAQCRFVEHETTGEAVLPEWKPPR